MKPGGSYSGRVKLQRLWLLPMVVVAAIVALILPTAGSRGTAASPGSCNTQVGTQVVGGQTVQCKQYPFVVAILDLDYGDKPFWQQFCGGSLIDKTHVLTAAHCVTGQKKHHASLRVVVGRWKLDSNQGQTRRVKSVMVHPDYHGNGNDAAVLELNKPVNDDITPVRLAGQGDGNLEEPGQMLTVAGWGSKTAHIDGRKNNKAPEYAHRMRSVEVPVVDQNRCADQYARASGGSRIDETMICAGDTEKGGVDSCQGDSGGPLFDDTQNPPVQVGIVSWGNGCADKKYPGVYTRVSALSVADFVAKKTQDRNRPHGTSGRS